MRTTLALFVAVVTSAAVFADEKEKPWEPHPRTTEYPWMSTATWKQLHESFLKRGKAGPVGLLFLGDSITQGWDGEGKAVWKTEYAPKNAANFGIGGDTTQNVLWRITTGGELAGLKPKAVVVMIGTNNFGLRNDTPEDVAKGVEAVVKAVREKLPESKVLLLGLFPRDAKPDTDFRKRIKATNERIAKLADGKMVVFRDIGDKFLDKAGNLPADIMPDALHLSPKGYGLWADAIRADLDALMKR
ncbi:MAG: GDSL family lipase [Gemmataceae bacterium]|nr:GDSL family lipase [Gemmataceae bacterium]